MKSSPADDPRPARARPGPALSQREEALLAATLEVLRESGHDKLTIDRVAARAHASKATVYRRWSNKDELVCAALAHGIRDQEIVPDTGTLRGDLLALAEIIAESARKYGPILTGILGAGERSPQLRALVDELYAARHRQFHSVLCRAAGRGEVTPQAVDDDIWDVLPGYLIFRIAVHGRLAATPTLTALVDEVVLPSLTRHAAHRPQPDPARLRHTSGEGRMPGT